MWTLFEILLLLLFYVDNPNFRQIWRFAYHILTAGLWEHYRGWRTFMSLSGSKRLISQKCKIHWTSYLIYHILSLWTLLSHRRGWVIPKDDKSFERNVNNILWPYQPCQSTFICLLSDVFHQYSSWEENKAFPLFPLSLWGNQTEHPCSCFHCLPADSCPHTGWHQALPATWRQRIGGCLSNCSIFPCSVRHDCTNLSRFYLS